MSAVAPARKRRRARRIVLITPRRAARARRAEGSGLHRLSGQAGARRLARRAACGDDDDSIAPRRPQPNARQQRRRTTPANGLSILVAEDNEINALLARALLTQLGHRPTVAANGDAALDSWLAARAPAAPYDLVLMDLHMPGIDGIEATRRIRALEAERRPRTPIIALTANAFTEDREACLAAGMDGFLVKPLDRERLAAVLRRISQAARQPAACRMSCIRQLLS